ncbi:molybdopterin adenylyltransferase [Pseudoduganella sp. SL102]|uniref:molybdopterin adenylyltransferase n=1 Tax=Pseudoduganella sp. SL102 TaxID=2995154 RepID=UPI00248B8340|nr:molybdopterin adenylyltransferase [Pseudoduganella sp. SL102]WBS02320.1 molybdopterin adenylyltransferase [Pseudoduganella sp. SL102]
MTNGTNDQVSREPAELVIGLVSVSDRASGGVYQDAGIPALEEWLRSAITTPFRVETRLIPDECATIEATLVELVDTVKCHLVLTTGGTGPARRDVTPEATLAIGTKEMPGFGEQMRQISLHFVPTAILSRQVAVIREIPDVSPPHAALVMNLPGQPKSIKETLEGLKDDAGNQVAAGIFAAVPYCIDLIGGPYIETDGAVCKAFRPKSALRNPPDNKAAATPLQ